ncbi:MAG: SH3 domain-containing protein [Bacillota bacterium]
MNAKVKLTIVLIIAGVFAAGFFAGKGVQADNPVPGSADDPLVSKSYVEATLKQQIADLNKVIDTLTGRADALQRQVQELQGKMNMSSLPQDQNVQGGQQVIVTASGVNVRTQPGTSGSGIIAQVNAGDVLTVITLDNGWYNVRLADGKTGWVSASLVQAQTTGQ